MAKTKSETIAKEFLLAEHALFKEFFQGDLEVAEKRVDLFIKLSTGVMAFIGALLGLTKTSLFEPNTGYAQILIVSGFLALAMLVIGHVILVRIAYRNVSLQKWKIRLGFVRKKLREISKSGPLKTYLPFDADREKYELKDSQRWDTGGLNEVMMNINTIILVVFLEILLELFRDFVSIVDVWWMFFPVLCGILGYFAGRYLQKRDIESKNKEWEKEAKASIERSKAEILV
jgi:hypothetical protein